MLVAALDTKACAAAGSGLRLQRRGTFGPICLTGRMLEIYAKEPPTAANRQQTVLVQP
jgi:hypothetical protein